MLKHAFVSLALFSLSATSAFAGTASFRLTCAPNAQENINQLGNGVSPKYGIRAQAAGTISGESGAAKMPLVQFTDMKGKLFDFSPRVAGNARAAIAQENGYVVLRLTAGKNVFALTLRPDQLAEGQNITVRAVRTSFTYEPTPGKPISLESYSDCSGMITRQ